MWDTQQHLWLLPIRCQQQLPGCDNIHVSRHCQVCLRGDRVRPRLRPRGQSLGRFGSSKHPLCCPALARAKLLRICKARPGLPSSSDNHHRPPRQDHRPPSQAELRGCRSLTAARGAPHPTLTARGAAGAAARVPAPAETRWPGGSRARSGPAPGGRPGSGRGSAARRAGGRRPGGQRRTPRFSPADAARGVPAPQWPRPGEVQDQASAPEAGEAGGGSIMKGLCSPWPPTPPFPREGGEDSYHVPGTSVPDPKHSSRRRSRPSGKFTEAHTTPAGTGEPEEVGEVSHPMSSRGRCPDTWWAAPWSGSSATFPVPSDKR